MKKQETIRVVTTRGQACQISHLIPKRDDRKLVWEKKCDETIKTKSSDCDVLMG